MNILCLLNDIGFQISWKLISIGLYGCNEIPRLLVREDVIEYLKTQLTVINEHTDKAISLICEEDNEERFDALIKKYAAHDKSDILVQKRKWRVYLLKSILNDISGDALQGQLKLMEFWMSMGKPDDCPQTFPSSHNNKSVQDYFTKASYEFNLNKNREWLEAEMLSIVKLEG